MTGKKLAVLAGLLVMVLSFARAEEDREHLMMGKGMMGDHMKGCMMGGMMGGYQWGMISEDLDLSDKQMEELREKNRDNMREKMVNKNELSLKLYDLDYELKKDVMDERKIDKLIDEIGEIHKKILMNRKKSLMVFKGVLTRDQWSKFKNMKMKNLYEKHMDKGMKKHMMK